MTLEERITRLEDIESIRSLQAKYQRCLDMKDFDGLSECFAEDVVSSYGDGSMSYNGRDEVLGFLREAITQKISSSHLIHGGEIDVKDACTASAKWYLEDFLVHRKYKLKLYGAAIYDVDYVKTDDRWQIKSIGYRRCYEYLGFCSLLNIVTLGNAKLLDSLKPKKK